ncbi:MAG: N-acetyltransferase [Candidatus Fermentibacter sp.]|nr:N-acetyltransferase [Candidatus Fermentibacter sp.]
MDLSIRRETQSDYREVEELNREAFWNLYFPGCNEHYLAHVMRSHPDFIPELDFVAESDGRIVGSIMYTRAWLVGEDGAEREIVSFGPLCVLPSHQRRGIGSALVRHTADIARGRGAGMIVIFGDPHNYCRLGFKSGRDYGISNQDGDCPHGMLALDLGGNVPPAGRRVFRYSDVYNIDEDAAQAFDSGFPPKEKGYSHTQEIFSIAIRSIVK